jgi:hypothetical protein
MGQSRDGVARLRYGWLLLGGLGRVLLGNGLRGIIQGIRLEVSWWNNQFLRELGKRFCFTHLN